MQVIFLGLPGAGKETQSKLLADQWKIPHISMSTLIRQAIAERTSLGLKAEEYLNLGQKLSDNFLVALIRERLHRPDADKGWILDGLPQNVIQAYSLERFLQFCVHPSQQVFYLNVSIEQLVKRLFRQRQITENEAMIRQLLAAREAELTPLIDFYQRRNRLQVIQGNREIADVALLMQKQIHANLESLSPLVSQY